VLAGLLAVFWGFVFYGLIDLLAFAQGPEFHATVVLSTGWGLLFLVLVAGPLGAAVVRAGTWSTAVGQVAVVAVAVAVAAGLSGSPRHLLLAGALLATAAALFALRPSTAGRARVGRRTSWTPGLLVVLAAGPACAYAWNAARTTGSGSLTDDTWWLDHWPVQAAFPLAVLGIAALAATRPPGWQLPTWTVGVATAWFGTVCWLEPDLVGSPGRGWAAAVLTWSIAFVVAQSTRARSAPLPGRLPRVGMPAPDSAVEETGCEIRDVVQAHPASSQRVTGRERAR
jgi:hypothetical protein